MVRSDLDYKLDRQILTGLRWCRNGTVQSAPAWPSSAARHRMLR
ncbi:hypothetical protein [Kitasatospora sp. NPDC092286]